MHATIIGAILTYLAITLFRYCCPSYPIGQELSLVIMALGGGAFYLGRKMYLNVILQTCSCFCGPGKCECTCGCREKCECYYRNKEEYYTNIKRRYPRSFS